MKFLVFISLMINCNAFASEKLDMSYMEELVKKQCETKMVKVIQEHDYTALSGYKTKQRYRCKEIAIDIETNKYISFINDGIKMTIDVYQKSLHLGYFSTEKEKEVNKMNFIIEKNYNSVELAQKNKKQILQDLVK